MNKYATGLLGAVSLLTAAAAIGLASPASAQPSWEMPDVEGEVGVADDAQPLTVHLEVVDLAPLEMRLDRRLDRIELLPQLAQPLLVGRIPHQRAVA